MKLAHDLLTEPILSWRDRERQRHKTTLPGVLAQIASGKLADFPQLRAHQFHPWCMFLTQLAAIALHRAKQSDPCLSEEKWRELLLVLTSGKHEPWCLLVEDLSKPAFFQPPVPEGSVDGWKEKEHPDDVDMLATAKNHDVKTSIISSDDIEAWVYALMTLQTMQGYYGSKKYGIARMNKGNASRPRVGLTNELSVTSRFKRDLDVLFACWPKLISLGYRDTGKALIWTQPWDGKTTLAMNDLSPHFIEICRRMRCFPMNRGLKCECSTSEDRFCLPNVDGGDVGDPWIPIERSKGALNIRDNGFDYKLLTKLLLGDDFNQAPAQILRSDDHDPVYFVGAALARIEGGTEGLHERTLPLRGKALRMMFHPDDNVAFAARSQERVFRTKIMRNDVLQRALKELALKRVRRLTAKRLTTGGDWLSHNFDARVDEIFFDHLFATLELDNEKARLAWDCKLHKIAKIELQQVIDRACIEDIRRYEAISRAESKFDRCLSDRFPDVVATKAEQGAHP